MKATVSAHQGSDHLTVQIPATKYKCLRFHHLHVGRSDCTIIEAKGWDVAVEPNPDEDDAKFYRSIIVDGGWASHALDQTVTHYQEQELKWGKDRIFDYMLLSHFHDDHYSGIKRQKIKAWVTIDPGLGAGAYIRTGAVCPRFVSSKVIGASEGVYLKYIQKHLDDEKVWTLPPFAMERKMDPDSYNTPVLDPTDQQEIFFRWVCGAGVIPSQGGDGDVDELADSGSLGKTLDPNEYSLGFIVQWGDFLYFSAGDAGASKESNHSELENIIFKKLTDPEKAPEWMRGKDNAIRSLTVVKSSHHGSATSVAMLDKDPGAKYWLEKLSPDTVITLANTIYSNLPSDRFFESLLATAESRKKRACASTKENHENLDFAAYVWNDFALWDDGKGLNKDAAKACKSLLAMADENLRRWSLISNLNFQPVTPTAYLTNRVVLGDSVKAIASIMEAQKNKKQRKRIKKEGQEPQEDSNVYFWSPLALRIDVDGCTLKKNWPAGQETNKDETETYLKKTTHRKLHDEIEVYRKIKGKDLVKLGSGAALKGDGFYPCFDHPMPFAKNNSKSLNAPDDLQVFPKEGDDSVSNKRQDFYPVGDKSQKIFKPYFQFVSDPFRRLFWISHRLAIRAASGDAKADASLDILLGQFGEDFWSMLRPILGFKDDKDSVPVNMAGLIKNRKSPFDFDGDMSKAFLLSDKVAQYIFDSIIKLGGVGYEKVKSDTADTIRDVLVDLFLHPLLGLVSIHFFSSTTTQKTGDNIPTPDKIKRRMYLARNFVGVLGLTTDDFDVAEFYKTN
ncbi:MAG TPA: hypothetical protein VFF03_02320 [Rhodocyclaceae bacterium]|nr:hypothetical protein [Rhodocyclaceae bacterium]